MSDEYPQNRNAISTDSFVRGIRSRLAFLILASSIAVALVFGLTFYFALLSNESAVARQIPELGQVASKMGSMLIMNTLVFVGVIIASFYVLARIVTVRLFRPLGEFRGVLLTMAAGKHPRAGDFGDAGAFGDLSDALRSAASRVADRDRDESAALTKLADELARSSSTAAAAAAIRDLLKRRTAQDQGAGSARSARDSAEKDPLFIQPV